MQSPKHMNGVVVAAMRDNGILWIELNRPERLNAMSAELMYALRETLVAAAANPAVRCVVLTGRGRGFCSGGDAERLASRPSRVDEMAAALDARTDELKFLQESVYLLHTMRKPTLALINGPAAGGGFSLALACDFRLASATATVGLVYARMGISSDFGASYFLQHMVGTAKARELLMLPKMMMASEAENLGLLTRVVGPAELLAQGEEVARQLADGPTIALGRNKENLHIATFGGLRAVLDREAENARISGLYGDAREGVQAFVEKREPRFRGE